MFDAHLIDEKGRIYRTRDRADGKESFVSTPRGYLDKSIISEEEKFYRTRVSVNLNEIPANAGRITYKAKFPVNESWPLPVSVIVRKRDDWTVRKAKTLSLKSIDLEPDMTDGSKFDVCVRVNYNGPYELIERPKIGQRTYGDFYYADTPSFYTYGLDYVYLNKEFRTPNRRLLVTNWSQRLEDGNRAESSDTILRAPNRQNPVKVTHVVHGTHYLIIYNIDLSKLKPRPKNMIFKAEIGVEGDGFLPVSVPLPPALVAKTAATPLP